jgi:eukaryotic-like serine/threonine-protein kinase
MGGDAALRETLAAILDPTDDPAMLGRLGPYEIMGVIGTGGMGLVLKAHDRALGRHVAMKVLAPHWAGSPLARRRFAREARAAAAVVHEHVIAVHAVSEVRMGFPTW